MNDQCKMLFIVGVGRSGTSLLQSMFASNSSLSFLPETGFIRRFLVSGNLHKFFIREGYCGVIQRLNSDGGFRRLGIDAAALLDEGDESTGFVALDLYHRLTQSFCVKSSRFVGDKDPRLVEFLPYISISFPRSHVIHVVRDPRDVLLSKKRAKWSRSGHVWRHIFANRIQLKLGVGTGPKSFEARYHQVIYEELIDDPERVLRGLCEGIGLPFNYAMLEFGGAAKKLVSKEEVSWKKETFGPILANNKDKWKEGLSPREIFLTEVCCRQAFKIGGYKLASQSKFLSLKDWLWVVMGAAIIIAIDLPYLLYRKYSLSRYGKK